MPKRPDKIVRIGAPTRGAIVLVAGLAFGALAHADVYTWVDAKGNTNVGNVEPPEGARILSVTRENPQAKAQAEAAREAARQSEVNRLAERVAELESRTEAAFNAPPPVTYAPPLSYAAPAPPPQVNVVVLPPAQPDPTAAYAQYGCAWVGCATSWWPYGYPAAFFVTSPRGRDFHRPSHPIRTPPRVTPPSMRMPMAVRASGRATHG